MKRVHFAAPCTLALVVSMILLATVRTPAQQNPAVAQVEKKAESLTPKGWSVPRTGYDQPDLQGYYTSISLTPTTRPKDLGDQLFYTSEEASQVERTSDSSCVYNCKNQDIRTGGAATDLARAYNDAFYDRGDKVAVTLQTSLIVDPPNGQMPSLTPAARKELADQEAELNGKCADSTRYCPPGYDGKTLTLADKPADLSLMSRCINWGTIGPPMLPSIYNSNYQILQTRDYMVIQVEYGRFTRIVPLDGRPHAPSNIRLLHGDSRGHWEGNTLVVDTTNFDDEGEGRHDHNLHVVERFTRVAPNVVLYEFTVDDPTVFTKPYTGIIPMTSIKGPIFEYACNEGNYAMSDILRGARLEEKKREEKPAPEGQSNAAPAKTSNGGSAPE